MATGTDEGGKRDHVPGAGRAVVELLNSRPHAIHADRLDDQEHAARILAQFAPVGLAGEAADAAQRIEVLRAIRSDLEAIVTAADEHELAEGWRQFTARTRDVAFQYDFTAAGDLATLQVAGDPVLGGVTRAVAELVSSGTWSRVRVCVNPACEGAFYDTTRSRTQKWDSYDTCGNRINVASYRARRSDRDSAPTS
jgi:predicted RNA-binding Zn ribbon-like protein